MRLVLFFAAAVAYAQTTVNAPAVTLNNDGLPHVLAWMSLQNTGVQTSIPSGIDASTVTITVASATGLAANSVIAIDAEHIGVATVVGNVLTVVRGYNGSIAASHSAAAIVKELKFRTLNLLAKEAVVGAFRQIVRQGKQSAINTATATAQAETEAAVQ
jgi:hypothetical protein